MGLVLYREKSRSYCYLLHRSCRVQTELRLDRDLYGNPYVSMTAGGLMCFRESYAWNGPNFFPKLKCMVRPSLKHDGCYQLIEDGLLPHTYRKAVDKELYQDMRLCDGWVKYAALPVYLLLRAVGGFSIRYNMYREQKSQKIYIAA